MKQYKLIISYVGTRYQGWQAQTEGNTISQTMQKAFEKTFRIPCTLIAASRTDAGVHASGQVVVCTANIVLANDQLRYAWNNALPLDIMIRRLENKINYFNPLLHVVRKTYVYTIYRNRPTPHNAPFGWYYTHPINIDIFHQALNLFLGTHNFFAFATQEPEVNPVRTIDNVFIDAGEEKIIVTVIGKSFIRHMIRRIVGAAVTVASNHAKTIQDIMTLLETPTSFYCFETAPAHGLSLEHIEYSQEEINERLS